MVYMAIYPHLNRRSVYMLDYLHSCHKFGLYYFHQTHDSYTVVLLRHQFVCLLMCMWFYCVFLYTDYVMPYVEHVFWRVFSFLSEREGATSSLWPSTCLMEGFMFSSTLLCGNRNYPGCPDEIIEQQKPCSLNFIVSDFRSFSCKLRSFYDGSWVIANMRMWGKQKSIMSQ